MGIRLVGWKKRRQTANLRNKIFWKLPNKYAFKFSKSALKIHAKSHKPLPAPPVCDKESPYTGASHSRRGEFSVWLYRKNPTERKENPNMKENENRRVLVRPDLTAQGIREMSHKISVALTGREPTEEENAKTEASIERMVESGKLKRE
ncbi:MAG: hypothetical protein AB8B55_17470 [Mariniblastus sp.]